MRVRGSVSSVFVGRNEYRNNVSMGMTRRSFYLSSLSDESLGVGVGKTAKVTVAVETRRVEGGRKTRRRGREREKTSASRRRWRYDSSFSVHCQYSQRAALRRPRFEDFDLPSTRGGKRHLPRLERKTGC